MGEVYQSCGCSVVNYNTNAQWKRQRNGSGSDHFAGFSPFITQQKKCEVHQEKCVNPTSLISKNDAPNEEMQETKTENDLEVFVAKPEESSACDCIRSSTFKVTHDQNCSFEEENCVNSISLTVDQESTSNAVGISVPTIEESNACESNCPKQEVEMDAPSLAENEERYETEKRQTFAPSPSLGERICKIDRSINWIKSELNCMRTQRLSLKREFEQLFMEIMELKLRKEMESGEDHDFDDGDSYEAGPRSISEEQ